MLPSTAKSYCGSGEGRGLAIILTAKVEKVRRKQRKCMASYDMEQADMKIKKTGDSRTNKHEEGNNTESQENLHQIKKNLRRASTDETLKLPATRRFPITLVHEVMSKPIEHPLQLRLLNQARIDQNVAFHAKRTYFTIHPKRKNRYHVKQTPSRDTMGKNLKQNLWLGS